MTASTGAAYVDVARSSLPRPEPAAQDVDREAATRRPSGDSADDLTPLSAIPEIPGQYSLAFKPTVVVIMLGTNDSKPQNWDKHKQDFAKDLGELIDAFSALDSKPAIWLCLPPPVQRANFGIRPEVVEKQLAPLVATVAKERKLGAINVFGALKPHPEMFPDGVHPNADGAALIAQAVATALTSSQAKRSR